MIFHRHSVIAVIGISTFGLSMDTQESGNNDLKGRIRAGTPETWRNEINYATRPLEVIAEGLIHVARDPARSNDDRIEAVVVLGETKNNSAVQFLLDNITLRIDPSLHTKDVDLLRRKPCVYALVKMGWAAIPYVMKQAERGEWNDASINAFADVFLDGICRHYAVPVVSVALSNSTGVARENLARLLKALD